MCKNVYFSKVRCSRYSSVRFLCKIFLSTPVENFLFGFLNICRIRQALGSKTEDGVSKIVDCVNVLKKIRQEQGKLFFCANLDFIVIHVVGASNNFKLFS
jgi:hypothetical protein